MVGHRISERRQQEQAMVSMHVKTRRKISQSNGCARYERVHAKVNHHLSTNK